MNITAKQLVLWFVIITVIAALSGALVGLYSENQKLHDEVNFWETTTIGCYQQLDLLR